MITLADTSIPPVQTVPEAIAWWAERTPGAPALFSVAGDSVSYWQLQKRIEAFGHRLNVLGVGRGERVMLALPDGVPTVIAGLAATRAAVAVPINPALPRDEAMAVIVAVQPRMVIVAEGQETSFREAARRSGVPMAELDTTGIFGGEPAGGEQIAPETRYPTPDDLALILLTSGTTERSRLVPASHAALFWASSARAKFRGIRQRDRGLSSAPAYFVLGLAHVLNSLLTGGSAIVATAREIVQQPEAIRDLAPTWMWLSPALLESVLEAAHGHPAFAEWPLRFVLSGGAQVTPDLIVRGEALWQVPLLTGYGTTETMGFISAERYPATVPRKQGSSGLPRPELELSIRDASGASLPTGAIGEITTRGSHVFSGYLDDPDATAAAFFPGGWYRTGDLGYLDEDGYLFITGRAREMINRGGEKIAPDEVDEILRRHPAVWDAAAFALPDPRLGEDVAVAVVARDGHEPTPRQLRRWILDRLAPYKVPRRIWFVDELPRTGSGKVQRGVLAERFRERGFESSGHRLL